jgi:prepilin-type N-terminal cleavage/methylation domain-containing protein
MRGFTLVEVVVAMLLLTIILSLTQASVGSLADRVRLRNEAESLAWVLRDVRQQAISANQPLAVRFDAGERLYRYPEGGETVEHALAEGISFVGDAPVTAFTFNPSGAPSRGGHIGLTNRRGQMFVIINPDAGRVRLSDSAP